MKKIKLFSIFALFATALVSMSGCAGKWIDYVSTSNVKLNHEYSGKNFFTDGIAEVKLRTAIDGDTAHFVGMNGKGPMIKARFFGIDTPESTGKVQEYGKPASNFTKDKLKEASAHGTIVVSSPFEEYKHPEPDSTGERYVSLVWVNLEKEHAPINELKCLNLWIVQEGLSWVKNVQPMPDYADTFYAAESQAKKHKLNLHSGKPDPTFNSGEYEHISLLELKKDNVKTLTEPGYASIYNNERVAITGTVAGYSNHILYLQDKFIDDETGKVEYAGINIFTGMTKLPSKYQKVNTYLEVFGLCQFTENFGFQITDTEGRFPTSTSMGGKYDVNILKTPEENEGGEHDIYTFEYTPEQLSKCVTDNNFESLNCQVKLSEPVEIIDCYMKSIREVTLTLKGLNFGLYFTFGYAPDPTKPSLIWSSEEDFIGQKLRIDSGIYTYHKTLAGDIQYQINPSKATDVVYVGPAAPAQ